MMRWLVAGLCRSVRAQPVFCVKRQLAVMNGERNTIGGSRTKTKQASK